MSQSMLRWSVVRLVIIFDKLLNPSFKMMTGLVDIARTAASTNTFIY